MHLDVNRFTGANKVNGQELKNQTVPFAKEILRLWDEFTVRLEKSPHFDDLLLARAAAVDSADTEAQAVGITPLFE